MIALLKKGLRVLASELEFEIPTCRYIKRKMLKEAVKIEKYHDLKTNELHMFAGTKHEDKQTLEFVQEELDLKAVQIDNELARSQKQMEKKESNQDVEAEREGPADDWSKTSGGIEHPVKFPRSTPNEVVELYRKLDPQRRELERQRTYWMEKQGKRLFMNDSHKAEDGKKEGLANSLMVKENQHTDVLIGMKQHTEILAEGNKALMPCDFNFNMRSVNAGIVADAEKHLTQLNSQLKGKEVLYSRRQEGVDARVAIRTETSIEARSRQAARNQQLGDLLDQEIENIRKLISNTQQNLTKNQIKSASKEPNTHQPQPQKATADRCTG